MYEHGPYVHFTDPLKTCALVYRNVTSGLDISILLIDHALSSPHSEPVANNPYNFPIQILGHFTGVVKSTPHYAYVP